MIKSIHWEITNGCNLRCIHCLPNSGKMRENELSKENIFSALKKIAESGIERIYFTGGEPFFRSDFMDILKELTILGLKASVISNAVLLNDKKIKLLKEMKIDLSISLDGHNAEINDFIRGEGSFEKITQTLTLCKDIDIAFSVYVTINRKNIDSLDDFIGYVKSYNPLRIHLNEINIDGRCFCNQHELKLSYEQSQELPRIVKELIKKHYDEEISEKNEKCWVDGSSLYVKANGELYLCVEVSKDASCLMGDVRSFIFDSSSLQDFSSKYCCYSVVSSEHSVFMSNNFFECCLKKGGKIDTLEKLYEELDILYDAISSDCKECTEPDCKGYIWLLEKEVPRFVENDIKVIKINDGPCFIHSFSEKDGCIDVSVKYPDCSQLCQDEQRSCIIHNIRPFICRIYPVGLETVDNREYWVLHKDCLYVKNMGEHDLIGFRDKTLSIINKLSSKVYNEILSTYRNVDKISKFPDGENNFLILHKV